MVSWELDDISGEVDEILGEFDFFVYFQLLSHINFLVLFQPTAVQRGEVDGMVMAKPPPLREDDVDFYI